MGPTDDDIHELRRTLIMCTEKTLMAIAIMTETLAKCPNHPGTPGARIRDLAKQLPAP